MEPIHVHVQRDRALAKFWPRPVALASSTGFPAHELSSVRRPVEEIHWPDVDEDLSVAGLLRGTPSSTRST
jgi:hypothetical protein